LHSPSFNALPTLFAQVSRALQLVEMREGHLSSQHRINSGNQIDAAQLAIDDDRLGFSTLRHPLPPLGQPARGIGGGLVRCQLSGAP
jgi:hypothetical protein